MDLLYFTEKLHDAQRDLMLPHPEGEAKSIRRCLLAMFEGSRRPD